MRIRALVEALCRRVGAKRRRGVRVDAHRRTRASQCLRSRPGTETREGIATWAAAASRCQATWRWRAVLTRANGQLALAFYSRTDDSSAYEPFALNLLTLRGDHVSQVDAFIVRSIESSDPESYRRFPEQPADPSRLAGWFESASASRRSLAEPSRNALRWDEATGHYEGLLPDAD